MAIGILIVLRICNKNTLKLQIMKWSIFFVALCFALHVHAQETHSETRSRENKTIAINNDNGNLLITFENGKIMTFVINDEPVSPDLYDSYQELIDDFNQEPPAPPAPPTPPVPPHHPTNQDVDQSQILLQEMLDYLIAHKNLSIEKYKIILKHDYIKINGEKLSESVHADCLDIFKSVYGHVLNEKSSASFKKSPSSTSNSIKIVH